MKLYCVFNKHSAKWGTPGINDINEIFFDKEECEDYVNKQNEKFGDIIDYKVIDVNINTGASTIIKHTTNKSKCCTEVSYGPDNKIGPLKNYLIGNLLYINSGIIVEFVDKSKLD